MILLTRYMDMYSMFTCPICYDCLLFGLGHGKKKYSGVSLSFCAGSQWSFQPGIFSFSYMYERK